MDRSGDEHPAGEIVLRPENLLLTLYGAHVWGRPVHVATTSLIDVMQRVGVSPHATRSAIGRMVERGRLVGERRGRRVYYGLTPRSTDALRDGYLRIWRTGAVNRHWDGRWTLLSFNLPDSWQRQRHELRTRLLWAGFGPLQGGLWITPSTPDLDGVLDGLEAAGRVRAFIAEPHTGLDVSAMAGDVWDIADLARRYEHFVDRWTGGVADRWRDEPLGRQLVLQEEWRMVLRQEPYLPLELLPTPWPAERAQNLFNRLHAEVESPARAAATDILETIRVPEHVEDAPEAPAVPGDDPTSG